MATLKEIRILNNISQSQIADVLKTFPNVISNIENGTTAIDLENHFILRDYFKTKIDWPETSSPREKFETIENIIELFQVLPIAVVVEFLARTYRRSATPERDINHYAELITSEDKEETETQKQPCNCED